MSASSVTGRGHGASGKVTTTELAALANGPTIIFAGFSEGSETVSSPPIFMNTIEFPYALSGGADSYVIMTTSINAGCVYVSDRDEDDDENFTGFSFVSEADGTVMYLIAKVGSRPNL